MSRLGCLLLVLAASAQVAHAQAASSAERAAQVENATATATAQAVPTVQILRPTPVTVPTVTVLQPPSHVAKPKHKAKPKLKPTRSTSVAAVNGQWITAFLTSYCPGSAGWLSSSGHSVFYGMLANNYYAFGTRVYMPVIGMTGVVEDHMGYGSAWNQFDVWSPVCYSTPTGYFRVAVLTGSR